MTGPMIGYWIPTSKYLEQLVAIAHIWDGWRPASARDRAAVLRLSTVVHGHAALRRLASQLEAYGTNGAASRGWSLRPPPGDKARCPTW